MKLCECGCGQATRIAERTDTKAGQIKGKPLRFINGHPTTRKRGPDDPPHRCECGCGGWTAVRDGVARRFIHGHNSTTRHLTASDYASEDRGYATPCWIWRWASENGRGSVTVRKRRMTAYRAMYEQEIGPVPKGLILHHLCGVPACVRLDHLELMTQREHMNRHRDDLVRGQHRLMSHTRPAQPV